MNTLGPTRAQVVLAAMLAGLAIAIGGSLAGGSGPASCAHPSTNPTNPVRLAAVLTRGADGAPGSGGDGTTSRSPTAGGSCYGCDTTTRAGECGSDDRNQS
jgi:hypothetical protein